eukprot:TRINITY_DN16465_c0_g1_i1.p1 TRINITY_DN16465_c0_g1~~TRINITY_DN16465_c0_g1_i1.p1  ORF type:complete len:266 (+),score=55.73 TRINITY_DN16465_c0_g1_i1:59-799(+)
MNSEDKPATTAIKWDALESNPEVLTNLARALGMTESYVFDDVLGLDEELLFATGVEAVILLYPGGGEHRQTGAAANEDNHNLFFLEQTEGLGNACGTIAVIHALANSTKRGDVLSDGMLTKFMKGASGSNCSKIGSDLGNDKELNAIHQRFVQQGQSSAMSEDHVDYHFICFVNVKDSKGNVHLYELDGFQPERGRNGQPAVPIDHGTGFNPDNLLKDAAKIIKSNYVERNPDELRFSVIALQKPQ